MLSLKNNVIVIENDYFGPKRRLKTEPLIEAFFLFRAFDRFILKKKSTKFESKTRLSFFGNDLSFFKSEGTIYPSRSHLFINHELLYSKTNDEAYARFARKNEAKI